MKGDNFVRQTDADAYLAHLSCLSGTNGCGTGNGEARPETSAVVKKHLLSQLSKIMAKTEHPDNEQNIESIIYYNKIQKNGIETE